MKTTLTLLALSLAVTGFVSAADAPKAAKPKAIAYLTADDAAKAGPDFALQGEYANATLGAQVIALSEGKFRAVFHQGGLPGAGWNKSPKVELAGNLDGDKVVFAADASGWSAMASAGVLTGNNANGDKFELNKIVRTSPTLGARPPAGALVLFDGLNADAWQGGHLDERTFLAAGTKSLQLFTNFTLHVEFFLPFKPAGRGQDRGNSGVYLQDRYEVQVLDSFGLKGENNECGGIYTKHKPAVNMCLPPLTWQTYDLDFEAAQFDAAGAKTKNATITVRHNGVLIHEHAEINGTTTSAGISTETPIGGPIQLQGHGNPVFYQNIWAVVK